MKTLRYSLLKSKPSTYSFPPTPKVHEVKRTGERPQIVKCAVPQKGTAQGLSEIAGASCQKIEGGPLNRKGYVLRSEL